MVTLNAHFDGKTIVPDEPVSLATNQKLRITIEPIETIGVNFTPHADPTVDLMTGIPMDERDTLHIDPLDAVPADFVRKAGTGAGEIIISDDFDETPQAFKDYL